MSLVAYRWRWCDDGVMSCVRRFVSVTASFCVGRHKVVIAVGCYLHDCFSCSCS